MTTKVKANELTFEDWAVRAIKVLREYNQPSPKTGKVSKGISVKYSRYTELAKSRFGENFDVRAATDALIEQGILEGHPVKGSFMLYVAGDMPKGNSPSMKELEAKFEELGL